MIDLIANIGGILIALGFIGLYISALGILISQFRDDVSDRDFRSAFIVGVFLMIVVGLGLVAFAVVLLLCK